MMSDTKHFCPNTGEELRPAVGIPNIVIVCHMIERERGVGKRPDGFVYLETKQNLEAFKSFIQQQKQLSQGECYSEIINTELVQVDAAYAKELSKHRSDLHRPWIWEVGAKHNNIV